MHCGCLHGTKARVTTNIAPANVPITKPQYPIYTNIGYNSNMQYPQTFVPQYQPVYTQAIMYADSYGNLHSQEEYELKQGNI